jgi:hypothetical protein
MFQPMQVAILRWNNTKLYKREGTIETKGASLLQVRKVVAILEIVKRFLEW